MASVKDVATLAGVSASTVSIVMNGKSGERSISEATCARVLDAARRLGYRPNISARRLRNDRSGTAVVAVFWTTDFRASMMVRFLNGLHRTLAAQEHRIDLLIVPYRNDLLHEALSPRNEAFFNAAIICNASTEDMAFLESTDFNIPVVLYNRHSAKYDTVNIDDGLLGRMAAEVFVRRGHRRAAVLAAPPVFPGMKVRIDGFLDACGRAGLDIAEPLVCDNSMRGGLEGAQRMLAVHPEADCVFCASDHIAVGALRAFSEAGVSVPGRLELISIGNADPELEEFAGVPLSVIHIPMEEMAAACLDRLVERLAEGSGPDASTPRRTALPLEYRCRKSCGPMP